MGIGRKVALAVTLFGAMAAAGALWVRLDPEFGGRHDEERRARYARSPRWKDGVFVNQLPTSLNLELRKLLPMMWELLTAEVPDKEPAGPLPVVRADPADLASRDSARFRVTWFGHSTLLLEASGRKVLFDPMLGKHASPVPFLSPGRFSDRPPLSAADLPPLDAVVISHDHYDHLDLATVRALRPKTGRFLVPLGVGAHLERWGVPPSQFLELDWGDTATHAGLSFVCAPARHFSGRRLTDSFRTLWASWVVIAGNRRVYHSGDSGYGPHFRAIGAAHGPFDAVFMDCGQYNERWAALHMRPEETVRAAREAGGKLLLPIHWGAFALAMHSWYDPAAKVTEAARLAGLPLATPRLGEPVDLLGGDLPREPWWERVPKEDR